MKDIFKISNRNRKRNKQKKKNKVGEGEYCEGSGRENSYGPVENATQIIGN